jgi:gamma-glutamylcyclotransferase
MIVEKEPLNKVEKEILKELEKKAMGLNELWGELGCIPSKPTLKQNLDKLRKQKLINLTKAARKGQKDYYELEELAKRLRETIKRLEAKWIMLEMELQKLDKVSRNPSSDPEEIAQVTNYLVQKALNLGSAGFAAYGGFSEETKLKLLIFSQSKYNDFIKKASKIWEGSPERERQFFYAYDKVFEGLLADILNQIANSYTWNAISGSGGGRRQTSRHLSRLQNNRTKGSNQIWYFAYGSNLQRARLRERIGGWTKEQTAILKGYKLKFAKGYIGHESGRANIEPNLASEVKGAIYLITEDQFRKLDGREGARIGVYRRAPVSVESEGKQVSATTYEMKEEICALKPSTDYLNLVLDGLREHGYDENVINEVKNIGSAISQS